MKIDIKHFGLYTLDNVNKYIREGKSAELITLSEFMQEKRYADVAEKIAEDRAKRIILIAGPSSSRKNNISKKTRS